MRCHPKSAVWPGCSVDTVLFVCALWTGLDRRTFAGRSDVHNWFCLMCLISSSCCGVCCGLSVQGVKRREEAVWESSVPIASNPQCMPWSSTRSLLTALAWSRPRGARPRVLAHLLQSCSGGTCVCVYSFVCGGNTCSSDIWLLQLDSVSCVTGLQTEDAKKTAGDYASHVSHPAPPLLLDQWLLSRDWAVVG